jgi:O-antigen ligase
MLISKVETSLQRQFLLAALACLCIVFIALFSKIYALLAVPFVLLAIIWFIQDVRLLFYTLLFSIPLSITLGNDMDFPDEPLMLCVMGVFLFIAFTQTKREHWKKWMSHPLMIIIALGFIWLILTVLNSQNPILSVKFLAKKSWYLVPFLLMPLILYYNKVAIKLSFKLLFAPLLVMVLYVLYKYSAYNFSFESVHAPMYPFFVNHVIYGSMVSIFIPLIVGAIFISKRFSASWMLLLVGLFIFLVANYFSYSRAAWMAMFFAIGVYFLIRLKLMHIGILAFYALVLTGLLWLSHSNNFITYKPNHDKTMMYDESIIDHLMATIKGKDISSAERFYRWIAGIRMSRDYPLMGVGPNNFYDYYKPYGINEFHTWVSRNPERSTTHNYFLFMLVEQGYPALVLYASLIFAIFFYGQKLYHRLIGAEDRIIVMSVLCMIGALFINNFFSELIETDKIGSIFYLGIAVLIVYDLKSRSVETKLQNS